MGNEGAPKFKTYEPYRPKDVKRRKLGEQAAELRDRRIWTNRILDWFRGAWRDFIEYQLEDARPGVKEKRDEIQADMRAFLDDRNPSYRDIACVCYALALVEYHVDQLEDLTYEQVESMMELLEKRVLVRQDGEVIRLLGRQYALRGQLAQVEESKKLLEYLHALPMALRRSEQNRDGQAMAKLRSVSRNPTTGEPQFTLLSLTEFLTAPEDIEARCEINLARETPKEGPIRQGGTIFLHSNPEGDAWIEEAFGSVSRYIRQNGLIGLRVPRAVLAHQEAFKLPGERSRHRRNQYHQVWRLIERGLRTAAKNARQDFDGPRRHVTPGNRNTGNRRRSRRRKDADRAKAASV